MSDSRSEPKITDSFKLSSKMTDEFKYSIVNHAVASGRDANCFFQCFIHTLTSQSPESLKEIKIKYADSIKAFVDTFNSKLFIDLPVDFDSIIDISKKLHPLERESVFGPILRHTYNAMIGQKLLSGRSLPIDPEAIVLQPETVRFANAFGAEIRAYMNQEEFSASSKGMPNDVMSRIQSTEFKIGSKNFYCDHTPSQNLKNSKIFNLDIVYAETHLNYTLGDSNLNNEHRRQVITTKQTERGGIYATAATQESDAPLAKIDLGFSDIANRLCERFNLKQVKQSETKETLSETEKKDRTHANTLSSSNSLLSTTRTVNALGMQPEKLKATLLDEKKHDIGIHFTTEIDSVLAPSTTSSTNNDDISDEDMTNSAFGQSSDTAKKYRS